MAKIISMDEAVSLVKEGMSVMVGGFVACGTPPGLIDGLAEKNVKNLTIITNDAAKPGLGVGKLQDNGQIKKFIGSFIGQNLSIGEQWQAGTLEVELYPQGSFVEKIRCAGYGLGGILTPTGVGTKMAEGKQEITVNGKRYLLETPLSADIALIRAEKADRFGNLTYKHSARNFNTAMVTAAKTTIVEVDEIVDQIEPDQVVTPGVFVKYIVLAKGGK